MKSDVFTITEKAVVKVLVSLLRQKAVERLEKEIFKWKGWDYSDRPPRNLTEVLDEIQKLSRAEEEFIREFGENRIRELYEKALEIECEKFMQKVKKLALEKGR